MIVTLLGRQPALGMAELERMHGSSKVSWFSQQSALVDADRFVVERYGGIQKAGAVILDMHQTDWRAVSKKIVQHYSSEWRGRNEKITLGISAYGFDRVSGREVQKVGLQIKSALKQSSGSLRLIPNTEIALSSATSHHNKLGLSSNKVEIMIFLSRGRCIVAESCGAQNITALARRDQGRPKRDAFVGMLPPKLALQIVNLAVGDIEATDRPLRVLDPFCGTGVILQETLLRRMDAYGTDLADKMVDYSEINLEWLKNTYDVQTNWTLESGDAMTASWPGPIDAVGCESYLGQPFSAPPSPSKLAEVRRNCDYIISTFLRNIHSQLISGTPLCVAIPAWKGTDGRFTHLPLTAELQSYGYKRIELKHVTHDQLLYYRDTQVVARELLILETC